jgi:hypothetical protein
MAFVLRLLFAQADRLELVFTGTEQSQHLADRVGTLLAQRQVVLAAAALVGIALDQHLELAVFGQELGMAVTRSLYSA